MSETLGNSFKNALFSLKETGREFLAAVVYVNSNRPGLVDADGRLGREISLASMGYGFGESGPIDIRPLLDTGLPTDTISEDEGVLSGSLHYFQVQGDEILPVNSSFKVRMSVPLADFKYKKPLIDKDVFNPNETWEENERHGYYPIALVKDAYRGPNHWHRRDDAIFCAVQDQDGAWSTRYFPKKNIPKNTWVEATEIITANLSNQ